VDLITTIHTFLKILEHYCQKGQQHLVVQKIKLKRKRAKKEKSKICFYIDYLEEFKNIKFDNLT